jgi:uncharacterized tellurite resistance protein B-like protein
MHLTESDFKAMDEAQRVAVLETMVIGLVADNNVNPAEIRRFDEIVIGLPWGIEREVLIGLVKGAHQRITALKTPAEVHDYVIGLSTKLPTPELRDKVVFTMATIMFSDGEINQFEKNVLGLFVTTFGITSDRLTAIRQALGLPPPKTEPAPEPPTTN